MVCNPRPILLYSILFLSLGVLAFTSETSSDNALAKVSKSRAGDFQSISNYWNKACRNGVEYSTT
jgi:hypothetical protein